MRKLKVGFPRWNFLDSARNKSGQVGLLIAAVMLVGMAGMGWGAEPTPLIDYSKIMNIQGRATYSPSRGGGNLPDGYYDMTFKLQRSLIGALAIWADTGWTETKRVVVTNGVFNEQLGEVSSNLLPIFDPQYDYRMQISFGGENMDTAQDIVGIPLAHTARNVRGGTVVGKTPDSPDVTDTNFGVAGSSNGGSGVYGFSQSTNYWKAGVYGASSTGKGVMGYSGTGGIGVRGIGGAYGGLFESTNGYGVYGTSAGTATSADPSLGAGVVGKNTQATIPPGRIASPGVYGESTGGAGVYGRSSGENAILGITYGFGKSGVVGLSELTQRSNIVNSGVYGESARGYGIYGYSKITNNFPAICADNVGDDGLSYNADDGIALEVRSGRIKIQTGTSSSSVGIVCGKVQFASGVTTLVVDNAFVSLDSIIFITNQSNVSQYFWIAGHTSGQFTIGRNSSLGMPAVGYLIIN